MKEVPEDLTDFYRAKYPKPEEKEDEAEAAGKKGKKDDKKGKKDDKKGGKKKKDAKEDAPPEPLPPLNLQQGLVGYQEVKEMFSQAVRYRGEWEAKDESYNFGQKHDEGLAKSVIRVDVEREMRDAVDELLKANLAKIKAQLAGGAKAGKKKKGGKKGKGGGKKKKAKGKKGKPLPGEKIGELKDMDVDDMLGLLVEYKLICTYRPRRVRDLIGGFNYLGPQPKRETGKPWPEFAPSLGQVRGAITEYAILPLGSAGIKASLETCNVKSLMLYGPAGSGKTMMVEAIASELGALLINISPTKLLGLFPGKQGPTKLAHLIYKVLAALAVECKCPTHSCGAGLGGKSGAVWGRGKSPSARRRLYG